MNIYVIIVTYNGMKWLERCLKSVSQSAVPLKIVVVDNLSTDGSYSYIQTQFPDISLIQSGENMGFGRANNLGIQYALKNGAEAVLLLNQDAYIEPETVKYLISLKEAFPELGIISPTHMDGTGKKLDIGFGNCLKEKLSTQTSIINGNALIYHEVKFVNAAGWFIPREVLSKVGGFDPIFPHYGEDVDYCNRIRYHGYKIGISDLGVMIHDRLQVNNESVFTNSKKHELMIYVSKLSIVKNPNNSLVMTWVKLLIWDLKNYINEVRNSRFSTISYFVKSSYKIFKNLKLINEHKSLSKKGGPIFLD